MTREEAIKILKARPYNGEVLKALETLVPEYNESEDEKIRKTLLDYFSCTGDDKLMLNGVYVKDIIAYLEKMKEKEEGHDEIPVESTIEYRIGKKDGFIEGLEQGKKQFYWKPTEEDIRLFNKAVTTNTSLSPQERAQLDIVRMKFKHCPYIKQKSEWSEDDKKTLDCIINVLDRLGFEEYCKSSRDQDVEEERFYYKEIQVLKKLKSLCPQPKQEWSKEDEKMLLSIINAFRDGAVSTIGQEQWLKSLPERFNLQSKQEWTKEDESYLQTVINEMEANKKEAPEYEHKKYDSIILWLKFFPLSLKKRNEDIEKLCSNEWSEEDEERLMELISLLKEAEGYLNEHGNMFSYNPMLLRNWLKSLPERFNLQPKQEWSKKDEKMLAVISYKISQHQGNDDRSLFTPDEAEFICEMEDKFKSLLENEKASEENILDKPNNVNDVKFPFKAKIKANNKTVIISFGRLNKDRNQWIMYTSDYTNNFKEYMPKELELIKDE